MSYIRFDHINKYFGENHVLRDITLDIEQGGAGYVSWTVRLRKIHTASLPIRTGVCDGGENLSGRK